MVTTMNRKFISLLTAGMVAGFAVQALASEDKAELTTAVQESKAAMIAKDPSLEALLASSKGYVIFPTITKGGLGIGGAAGTGQLFVNGVPVGEATMKQASIGFQAGGQQYAEAIVFQDETALQNFKEGNFDFSAQASAVALQSGASQNAKFEDGVAVLTMAEKGLMAEASVGGQKFSFTPY
jgi:lipid-binding SYLF domain-containing protein